LIRQKGKTKRKTLLKNKRQEMERNREQKGAMVSEMICEIFGRRAAGEKESERKIGRGKGDWYSENDRDIEFEKRADQSQDRGMSEYAPSGEAVALAILHVGDLETTLMLLAADEDTYTALVRALGDHAHVSGLELERVDGLA
jgi:hypothetical protein